MKFLWTSKLSPSLRSMHLKLVCWPPSPKHRFDSGRRHSRQRFRNVPVFMTSNWRLPLDAGRCNSAFHQWKGSSEETFNQDSQPMVSFIRLLHYINFRMEAIFTCGSGDSTRLVGGEQPQRSSAEDPPVRRPLNAVQWTVYQCTLAHTKVHTRLHSHIPIQPRSIGTISTGYRAWLHIFSTIPTVRANGIECFS